jgi:hypothetical protein
MAIDFPDNSPNGEVFVDSESATKWVYNLRDNSWTLIGSGMTGGLNYIGGIEIQKSIVDNNISPQAGDIYTVNDGGFCHPNYDQNLNGLDISVGQGVIFDGQYWSTRVEGTSPFTRNISEGRIFPVHGGDDLDMEPDGDYILETLPKLPD